MKLKLGICEDDPFTLATLDASISAKDIEVSFAESNAGEALKQFKKYSPHAVLIDLHLGAGPTGLDLARSLRAISPEVGVVFLTSFESPRLVDKDFANLPAGSQYLNKQRLESIDEILQAVQRSVSKNRKSAELYVEGVSKLTKRQLEVLELIADGETNQEIARKLELSAKTVEGINLRIVKSLGIEIDQTRNQRIQMARAYLRSIGRVGD